MNARLTTQQTSNADPFFDSALSRVLQRKCDCGQHTGGGSCSGCEKKRTMLQRNADSWGMSNDSAAPPIVHEVLKSPGRPLDAPTRAYFETRFVDTPSRARVQSPAAKSSALTIGAANDGFEREADHMANQAMQFRPGDADATSSSKSVDFARVRVHTDASAAESARAVGASAYTVGEHVVFGAGRYAPQTAAGKALLAHELTHVLQQSSAPVVQRQGGGGAAPAANHRFTAEGVSVVVRQSCSSATFGFQAVEDATRDALDRIFNTECIETSRRTRMQRNLTRHGLDIRCALTANLQTPGACAESTGFSIPANIFTLSSAAAFPSPHPDRNAGCPAALGSTVLHEVVHLVRGIGTEQLPDSCENACFGTARGTPDLCRDIDVNGRRVRP